MKKIIAIITSNRAEYGLLNNLIKKIDEDSDLRLKLIVTGSHLLNKYGYTINEINKDKIKISHKIKVLYKNDTSFGTSTMMSETLNKFTNLFSKEKIDLVIILGDRFEIFAVAAACTICNVPIAHIHGGELTLGSIDDTFRHSITKMSHLHFTSHLDYHDRVIQLGENPKNVFNFGGLGAYNIKKEKLLSKKEVEENLNFKFNKKNIIVTFHPETKTNININHQLKSLFTALQRLKNVQIIITQPNIDKNNQIIIEKIKSFIKLNKNALFIKSMGHINYLSSLRFVDGVVGNSSSGILEVPSFNIGTVNIGFRQLGRITSKSIVNCGFDSEEIYRSISKIIDSKFKYKIKKYKNIYEKKNTVENILKIIKKRNLNLIKFKKFYDL